MSASMCSEDHLSAVADIIFRLFNRENGRFERISLESDESPEFIFKMLMTENALSLESRYPADWHDMIPGRSLFGLAYSRQLDEISFNSYPQDAARLASCLKALDCYAYQACEHDGWQASRAYALVSEAQASLGMRLSKCHPAYDSAEWGWAPARKVRARR